MGAVLSQGDGGAWIEQGQSAQVKIADGSMRLRKSLKVITYRNYSGSHMQECPVPDGTGGLQCVHPKARGQRPQTRWRQQPERLERLQAEMCKPW